MSARPRVLIVGAGIGGLTLALELHKAGFECRIFEAAAELKPIGVGINILPHASRVLSGLGLEAELSRVGVITQESVYYNRFGQHIFTEPAGRNAGYEWPQYSIHRGDLQTVLARAVVDRLGPDALVTGHRCVSAEQDEHGVTVHFRLGSDEGAPTVSARADAVVACDGVHSAIRKQLHPGEGAPRYSGYNMWRGVAPWEPVLSGASMIRAGWLATGKMVIYPIRDRVDEQGRQLVNWVAEIETPRHIDRDWNRSGQVEDFVHAFADWQFDWLDVPALIRSSQDILEYPMVDQDPLDTWGEGRITLLGDAAHPMVPRGSNGAGQAILDARALVEALTAHADDVRASFTAYENERRPATAAVVQANRTNPPDAILREVYERTGDQPFEHIEDVIPAADLESLIGRYKTVAGYSQEALARS